MVSTLPHVSRSSGEIEWYSPEWIVEDVRTVLGGIDLDPASCAEAQRIVRATTYFDIGNDGLSLPWYGRVFLNPPYARGVIERWAKKFALEWEAGHIREAIVLVNNATETGWFNAFANVSVAMCAFEGRVSFWGPAAEGVERKGLQGQVAIYYGWHIKTFMQVFGKHGQIYLAIGDGSGIEKVKRSPQVH